LLERRETRLKRWQRRVSRQHTGSKSCRKAVRRLAKGYLKVSRQRKDFACQTAKTLIQSHDVVASEDLKSAPLVKNRHLGKSSSDAAWGRFWGWLQYSGTIAKVPVRAVPPAYTSQTGSRPVADR